MIGQMINSVFLLSMRICELRIHRELVKNHQDSESLPTMSKMFAIMNALDTLPGYLCEQIEVCRVTFSYIIQENPNPGYSPNHAQNSVTSAHFDSVIWISSLLFVLISVLNITELVKDTPHASLPKPYTTQCDRRLAQFVFFQHYMGNTRFFYY